MTDPAGHTDPAGLAGHSDDLVSQYGDPQLLHSYREGPGSQDITAAIATFGSAHYSAILPLRRRRWFAFALTVVAVIASIVFFAIGNDVAGGVLLSFAVVVLIWLLVRSGGSD